MDDCRLIDEIQQPVRCYDDFLSTSSHALNLGLHTYLSTFICSQSGDWPAQFDLRWIQYNQSPSLPTSLKKTVPMIRLLHVQLYARGCVCLLNIELFKKAYSYFFGEQNILANKPKTWRIFLILELL